MYQYFTGLLAALIAIYIAFFAPIQQQSSQINTSAQTLVNESVTNFVDQVRQQGYITGQDYRKFLNNLEGTGNVYDISIVVLSEKYYPSDNEIDYEVAYIPYSESEIVEELGNLTVDDIYKMKNGDQITVTVRQKNMSVARRLSNTFLSTAYSPEIYCSYSGAVGNEAV